LIRHYETLRQFI